MSEAIRYGMAAAANNLEPLLPARLSRQRVEQLAAEVKIESSGWDLGTRVWGLETVESPRTDPVVAQSPAPNPQSPASMSTLTWLGHNCWLLAAAGKHVLVDPFLDDSPTAPVKAADVKANYILVSHGHYDHVADAAKIAKRTGATVAANFEICEWLAKQGVTSTEPMNLGGSIAAPFGRAKLTVAHHSSVLPDGTPGGNPGGFLLTLADAVIYFACDTALFSDMALYNRGENGKPLDVAVLPIGDRFTMGPADSIEAIAMLRPRRVLPAHYNTWPPIAQDAEAWAQLVRNETDSEPVVLQPGQSVSL